MQGSRSRPTFEAKSYPVAHLLGGNYSSISGAMIKMPAMQRPFEWFAAQCKKFLEQLLASFESNDWQSFGNIFLWRKNESFNTRELLVMDGAHRLSMIFMLMSLLRHIRKTEFNKIKRTDGNQDNAPVRVPLYNRALSG